MMKFAATMVAAVALGLPGPSVAQEKPANAAKPSSFVPHAHSKQHVYGAPIGPAVVGRGKTSHHRHVPKN